jgi:sporulation protein YlmC with PRC-barrel domain
MVEITKLFWKKVYSSDSFLLGEVNSAELNESNWQIMNLYVVLTDEAIKKFGFSRPFLGKVIVCLPVSTVDSFKDTVKLKKTMAELMTLKECKE